MFLHLSLFKLLKINNMTPFIMKNEDEINKQIDLAYETQHNSKYSGMSYEQGVLAMYDWLVGNTEDLPIEED